MINIVLATNSTNKIREFKEMFSVIKEINLIAQSYFSVPDIEEIGQTFVENALIKARNAAKKTNFPVLSDDSGLMVDALDGAPGIHSARYAGNNISDEANNRKLLANLHNVPIEKRTAQFICVLVFMRSAIDQVPLIYQASWHGLITNNICGLNGFGYDPLFWIPSEKKTAAQLPTSIKNLISHRGQVVTQFCKQIQQITLCTKK